MIPQESAFSLTSTFCMQEEEAKQQPKEEEDAKGVEMEGDFDGDIHDVPSDAENSEEEEGDEEEGDRLDQEMGDVGEQGEVVDERMWGDEDKPEPGQKPGEEKYEKDAPVQVPPRTALHAECLKSLLGSLPCDSSSLYGDGHAHLCAWSENVLSLLFYLCKNLKSSAIWGGETLLI